VVKAEAEQEYEIEFDRHFADEVEALGELERDGMVSLDKDRIQVSPLGRIFIRNIAMTFDPYLKRSGKNQEKRFSKTL
jgi:oxygen-independent coproporphyrinogen-3 oxidase